MFRFARASFALCGLLCLAAPSAWSQSGVCTVVANDPHSSIQQAVNSGCTQIRVTPGTYRVFARLVRPGTSALDGAEHVLAADRHELEVGP